jgi:N-sulfoglucosamine sulfohydrolase
MYHPMRCVRTWEHKLIWNLAHQIPYPIAGDIRRSPSWTAIFSLPDGKVGGRTMEQNLHRPEFELYDLRSDPLELRNLAKDSDPKGNPGTPQR